MKRRRGSLQDKGGKQSKPKGKKIKRRQNCAIKHISHMHTSYTRTHISICTPIFICKYIKWRRHTCAYIYSYKCYLLRLFVTLFCYPHWGERHRSHNLTSTHTIIPSMGWQKWKESSHWLNNNNSVHCVTHGGLDFSIFLSLQILCYRHVPPCVAKKKN